MPPSALLPPDATLEADRRRDPRYSVSFPCTVSTKGGVRIAAEVTNLSRSGFRARSTFILAPGTRVDIRGKGKARKAIVVRQPADEVACAFLHPLSDATFAALMQPA